ncbi:hypothetical protein D9M69_558510 [compost metagenome]
MPPSQPAAVGEVQIHAVAYAPMPTNAAWPKGVMPPTPVSMTSPAATSAYRPMLLSTATVKSGSQPQASASATMHTSVSVRGVISGRPACAAVAGEDEVDGALIPRPPRGGCAANATTAPE